IRKAKSPQEAHEKLAAKAWAAHHVLPYLKLLDEAGAVRAGKIRLSDEQIKAILELRLHRLTALGRDEIGGELEGLAKDIRGYLDILTSKKRLGQVLAAELKEVKAEFNSPRKTRIEESEAGALEDEDLIQREEMVVTVTHTGYIKRVPLATYRAQRRGGKGRAGMATKEEDFLTTVFIASTLTPVLFFSSAGIVYKLKAWKLPLATPQAKGKAIINLLPLGEGNTIEAILPLPEDEKSWSKLHVMFTTASGQVRRNLLSDFTHVMANGKIAIKLDEGDRLVSVQVCGEKDDVLLAAAQGKSIRFAAKAVRLFKSRTSSGVRGMRLKKGDKIISMTILKGQNVTVEERNTYLRAAPWKGGPDKPALKAERMAALAAAEEFILTVTANGYGKRTSAYEYRVT
ncbi:MAG TPA: DNA gyrase C-terminal beta-propeller domain-containing protein, partial [Sphingomonadales bacterium]|nr:DNA gyrase C-terminal beta-propeller domain-containing protein [Sphingomonadales bacterium]